MCAGVPGRVRGPGRPPLPRPAQRLPGRAGRGAAARGAGGRRRRRGGGRRGAARRAGSSRSRASAATTSPAAPTTSARWRALRARKHREDKPFALMVADLRRRAGAGRSHAAEEERAAGVARAPDRARRPPAPDAAVAAAVAPGRAELGRDAALHAAAPPAARRRRRAAGDDQRQRLRRADRLPRRRRPRAPRRRSPTRSSIHDRPIETRTDDSVAPRSCAGARSCCAARAATCPRSLPLPVATPVPLLALGAELKSTFCVAARDRAPGSATTSATSRTTRRCARSPTGIAHFERLLGDRARRSSSTTCIPSTSRPSTRSSARASRLLGVQHHHAHLAACLAEHGETRAGGRRDLRRRRLGRRRHGLGRRDPRRRPAGLRARRPPRRGAASGRRRRRAPAVADGLRVAGGRRSGRRRRCPRRSRPLSTRAPGRRSRSWCSTASRRR